MESRHKKDESLRLQEYAATVKDPLLARYLYARAKAIETEKYSDWLEAWKAQSIAEKANRPHTSDYLDYPIRWNGKKEESTTLFITINNTDIPLLSATKNIKFASSDMISSVISNVQNVLNYSNQFSIVNNLKNKFGNNKMWNVVESCGDNINKLSCQHHLIKP